MEKATFIDLFCGCGGFTLGMERAGFRTLAAIDMNPEAVTVFRRNFPHVGYAFEKDLIKFGPDKLAAKIGEGDVDG
ncbi:DNA cytosine methyltransferase [Candidatus Sumerlaeota bacterium]|nr:DNA cytosine methyltransferase [Candidatus Sumerlaeota bacterium]MBI3735174.1 DNA cytosine methyltransferase [Candidatus Sumerlaeota bacterium]